MCRHETANERILQSVPQAPGYGIRTNRLTDAARGERPLTREARAACSMQRKIALVAKNTASRVSRLLYHPVWYKIFP
jgi:hypothetical protein